MTFIPQKYRAQNALWISPGMLHSLWRNYFLQIRFKKILHVIKIFFGQHILFVVIMMMKLCSVGSNMFTEIAKHALSLFFQNLDVKFKKYAGSIFIQINRCLNQCVLHDTSLNSKLVFFPCSLLENLPFKLHIWFFWSIVQHALSVSIRLVLLYISFLT